MLLGEYYIQSLVPLEQWFLTWGSRTPLGETHFLGERDVQKCHNFTVKLK